MKFTKAPRFRSTTPVSRLSSWLGSIKASTQNDPNVHSLITFSRTFLYQLLVPPTSSCTSF